MAQQITRADVEAMANRLRYEEIVETGGKTYRLRAYIVLTHPPGAPIGVSTVIEAFPYPAERRHPPALLRRRADLGEKLDAWEKGEGPWPESP